MNVNLSDILSIEKLLNNGALESIDFKVSSHYSSNNLFEKILGLNSNVKQIKFQKISYLLSTNGLLSLNKFDHLLSLNVNNCNLGYEYILQLIKQLNQYSKIKVLGISNNAIDVKKTLLIFKELGLNKTIYYLDTSHTIINYTEVDEIMVCLKKMKLLKKIKWKTYWKKMFIRKFIKHFDLDFEFESFEIDRYYSSEVSLYFGNIFRRNFLIPKFNFCVFNLHFNLSFKYDYKIENII
jgi:hypothetical protein